MTRTRKRYISAVIITVVFFIFIAVSPIHAEPRLVVIVTDDGAVEVSTTETVVGEILAEASITLDPKYEMTSPALDAELDMPYIVIKRAAEVVIKSDGKEMEIISWAKTVEELFREQNISIDDDLVNYPLEQSLKTGLEIEIVRVDKEKVFEEAAIAAETKYKSDSSLAYGKEKVQTEARDGKKQLIYEVTYHDGIEIARRLVSEEVLVQPVTGIVLRGTRTSVSRGSTPAAGDVIEGIASFYGAELHGNKTASGVPFDMYAFTAAHKTLPFGTLVKVTYLSTGKSVVVEINDRGPFTPGRIIDLSAAAAKEIGLYADGIGKVKIEILN